MLPAHYYPELKKYPHLYGNYGNAWHRQNSEFAAFNGPILMTTNCITPVQESYRNRIFTTGMPDIPAFRTSPTGRAAARRISRRSSRSPEPVRRRLRLRTARSSAVSRTTRSWRWRTKVVARGQIRRDQALRGDGRL